MKKIYILLFIFIVSSKVKAQQDLLMFNQLDIPQSSFSNPANQFNGKGFLGLPLISSTYYSFSSSGFAYSDFIKKDGDSLQLDFNSMINELNDEDYLAFQTKLDLFSFGFRVGKRTVVTANITENIGFKFNYTKDFIQFIDKGNIGFNNGIANFENLGIQASYYREFGFGISHQFGNKLQIGARYKYLYGIANFDSKKVDLSLQTDPTTYAITARANVEFNTSGNVDLGDAGGSASETFLGNENTGYAVDFGANYEINKKLSVSASVIDLGLINWRSNVNNYTIEEGEYVFNGLAIDAFAPQSDSNTSVFSRIEDSLKASFNVSETKNAYTSNLAGRIYAGAHYKYNEKLQFGALLQSEFFKNNINPSVTLNANYKLFKWITLASSWTYINNSYNNIGLGLNINPGPIQVYLVSDNILSGFRPQHARHAQVRVGINLIFGSEKTKDIHPSFDGVSAEKREKKSKKKEKKSDKKETETSSSTIEPKTPLKGTAPTAKKDSAKTIIEAVEQNNKKIVQDPDSLIKSAGPMIHPTAPKLKPNSGKTESKKVVNKETKSGKSNLEMKTENVITPVKSSITKESSTTEPNN